MVPRFSRSHQHGWGIAPPIFFFLKKKTGRARSKRKTLFVQTCPSGQVWGCGRLIASFPQICPVPSGCAETLLSNYAYAASCDVTSHSRVLIEATYLWPRCCSVGGVSKEGAAAPALCRLKGWFGGGKSAKRRLRRIKRADFRGSGTIDGPDTGRESYRRNGGPRPKSPSWRVFWTGRGPFSPRGENGGASAQLSSWLSPKKKERPPPGSPSFKTAPPGPAAHHRRWCAAAGRSHSTAGRQWPFSG